MKITLSRLAAFGSRAVIKVRAEAIGFIRVDRADLARVAAQEPDRVVMVTTNGGVYFVEGAWPH